MNSREALLIFEIDGSVEIDARLKAGEDPRSVEHRIKTLCKSKERPLYKKYHPDGGGSHDAFLKYQEAIKYMEHKFRIKVIGSDDHRHPNHSGPTDRSARFFDEEFNTVNNMGDYVREMMRNSRGFNFTSTPGSSNSTNGGFKFHSSHRTMHEMEPRVDELESGPNGEKEEWVRVHSNGRIDSKIADLNAVEIIDEQIRITGIAFEGDPNQYPHGKVKGYIHCNILGQFVSIPRKDMHGSYAVFTHEFPINSVQETSESVIKEFCAPTVVGSIDLTDGRATLSVERGGARCFKIERNVDGIEKAIIENSRIRITHIKFEGVKLDMRDKDKRTPLFKTVKR